LWSESWVGDGTIKARAGVCCEQGELPGFGRTFMDRSLSKAPKPRWNGTTGISIDQLWKRDQNTEACQHSNRGRRHVTPLGWV
jgi:hypothetical protein